MDFMNFGLPNSWFDEQKPAEDPHVWDHLPAPADPWGQFWSSLSGHPKSNEDLLKDREAEMNRPKSGWDALWGAKPGR